MSIAFTIAQVLLGVALLLLAHTYAVYPLLMRMLSRRRSLPERARVRDEDLPELAVLMAVYNEEKVLVSTLSSILASDYPREKIQVFIGSDGSTDRSNEIIKGFAKEDRRLRLVPFGGRNGKIRIINHLAEGATSTFADPERALFVLCDANVEWTPDLLRRMAEHYQRDEVGLVGCAVIDKARDREGIGDQEDAYIGMENEIKFAEGVFWGRVMGAFGACYSMRASLFDPVPTNHIVDDFYLTMLCLEKRRDAIVDLDAVCHEAVSTDISEEKRRKRRIATGNFQNLCRFWSFLLPWRGGCATSFAFWSHKGLRWFGPQLLITAGIASLALLVIYPTHPLSLLCSMGMAAAALAVFIDTSLHALNLPSPKLLRFIRYFFSMNLALFLGWIDFLRGPQNSVWEPTRRDGVDKVSPASMDVDNNHSNNRKKQEPALH